MAENNTEKELNKTGTGLVIDEGTIKTIIELANTVKLLEGYLNDQIIQDLAGMIGSLSKLANLAASTDLISILERAAQDPGFDRALLDKKRGGMIDILMKMRDKDVYRGMYIMLEFLRAIGKASREDL